MKEIYNMRCDQEGTASKQEAIDLSLWSSYCGLLHADKSGSKPSPICAPAQNSFSASCNPEIYIDMQPYDLLYLEEVN